MESMMWKNIYVLRASDGLVKIGVSQNVEERIKQIENVRCKIEDYFITNPCVNYLEVERKCHDLLREGWMGNEWFEIDYIDAIEKVKEVFFRYARNEKGRIYGRDRLIGSYKFAKSILGNTLKEVYEVSFVNDDGSYDTVPVMIFSDGETLRKTTYIGGSLMTIRCGKESEFVPKKEKVKNNIRERFLTRKDAEEIINCRDRSVIDRMLNNNDWIKDL
jgi:hypothetical protein